MASFNHTRLIVYPSSLNTPVNGRRSRSRTDRSSEEAVTVWPNQIEFSENKRKRWEWIDRLRKAILLTDTDGDNDDGAEKGGGKVDSGDSNDSDDSGGVSHFAAASNTAVILHESSRFMRYVRLTVATPHTLGRQITFYNSGRPTVADVGAHLFHPPRKPSISQPPLIRRYDGYHRTTQRYVERRAFMRLGGRKVEVVRGVFDG